MINLLPPENKQAIKYGRLNVILMQYIILALIVIVALVLVLVVGSKRLSNTQSDIRAQVQNDKNEVEELLEYQDQAKNIADQVNTLSNIFDREVKFSELLTSIGGVMPTGSSLTQLSLNEDRTLPLNLTAVVVDESTAAVLRKNLEESDIFDKADIVSITAQEDETSQYKYQVSISVVFAPNNGDGS